MSEDSESNCSIEEEEFDEGSANDLEIAANFASQDIEVYSFLHKEVTVNSVNEFSTILNHHDMGIEDDDLAQDKDVMNSNQVPEVDSSETQDSDDSEEDVPLSKVPVEAWFSEEEEDFEKSASGPPRTKNEVKNVVEELVVVKDITVSENDTLIHIGHVLYSIEAEYSIIVQGIQNKSPLEEGSVLCLTDRVLLGRVYEIFGPISSPYYVVKCGTVETVPKKNDGKNWRNTNVKAGKKKKNRNSRGRGRGNDPQVQQVDNTLLNKDIDYEEKNIAMDINTTIDTNNLDEEDHNSIVVNTIVNLNNPTDFHIKVETGDNTERNINIDKKDEEGIIPLLQSKRQSQNEDLHLNDIQNQHEDQQGLEEVFENIVVQKMPNVTPGALVYCVQNHSNFVTPSSLNELKRMKGTDASNIFDEEIGLSDQEFSDDEQERVARQQRKRVVAGRVKRIQSTTEINSCDEEFGDFLPTQGRSDRGRGGGHRGRSTSGHGVRQGTVRNKSSGRGGRGGEEEGRGDPPYQKSNSGSSGRNASSNASIGSGWAGRTDRAGTTQSYANGANGPCHHHHQQQQYQSQQPTQSLYSYPNTFSYLDSSNGPRNASLGYGNSSLSLPWPGFQGNFPTSNEPNFPLTQPGIIDVSRPHPAYGHSHTTYERHNHESYRNGPMNTASASMSRPLSTNNIHPYDNNFHSQQQPHQRALSQQQQQQSLNFSLSHHPSLLVHPEDPQRYPPINSTSGEGMVPNMNYQEYQRRLHQQQQRSLPPYYESTPSSYPPY